jgi:LuxR family maltose regulon positive regulatory protein
MLVPTKLFIPQIRSFLVERQRLTNKVATGKDRKLILVCAPVGFGKTSMVCQWIQQEQPKVAWYALDEDDGKPEVFFRYLLAALQRLDDHLKTAFMPLIQNQTLPSLERLVPLLVNHLATLSGESYLVLDDYHLIQPDTSPIHQAIRELIQHAPPQFHIVIMSRNELPFPVARLRVNQEITEIQGADLRFTEAETVRLFESQEMPRFSKKQLHALHQYTEGWIACLQLAGRSCHDQADIDGIMSHLGIQRPIADYLLEEVFQEQTPAVQEFLLNTSVLKRLNIDLCNVLNEQDNAVEMLEYLETTNLFVVSLDAERQWFRYHHILSDYVQHRLRQTDRELWTALHMKAAVWHANREYFDEARRHAIASGNLEFAADLLEQHGSTLLRGCHFSAFWQWYRQLPDDLVEQRLLLKLNRVSIAVQQHDFTDIDRLLTELEDSLSSHVWQRYPEGLIPRVRDVLTAFRIYRLQILQQYDQAIKQGEQALHTMDIGHPESRGLIQASLAFAYIEQGDVLRAIDPIKAGFESMKAAKLGFSAVALLWYQARAEKLQGHLHQAEAILHKAFSWAQESRFVPLLVTVALHTASAELLYEQNRLDRAKEHVDQAIEYAEAAKLPGFLWLGYWLKACICQALNMPEEAWLLGEKALKGMRKSDLPGYIHLAEAYLVRLSVRQSNMEFPLQWMERRQLRIDEPFSQTFEEECLSLSALYLKQQRYREALDLLTGLRPRSLGRHRTESVMRIDILRAIALDGKGERQAALSLLEEAIVLAKPEGYVRIFADHAFLLADLLLALQRSQDQRVRAYIPSLLDACGVNPTVASSHVPINDFERLTPREVEILRLMTLGYTNQQIADQTFVALSTVKSHIKHIYGKLGVRNRAQALLWARTHLK